MGNSEDEISPFLKSRRAALDPRDLGLPNGVTRRRVRGLRREEVAQQAGISVDYYTRIEQGRARGISDSVLDAIAGALRLTPNEHTYLRNITLPRRPCAADAGERGLDPRPPVRPDILALLAALDDTVPAVVYGPGTDILAWNRIGARISFDYDVLPESELNSARLMFTHPDARELYPDWGLLAAELVASLRAQIGSHPDHPRVHRVIHELLDENADFRRAWEAHEVQDQSQGVKHIRHPQVGDLWLTYHSFPTPADPDQQLCTFSAAQGSESAERLRSLAQPSTVG